MSLRVLVAEDEAPQRDALLERLAALLPGVTLLPCADGLDALERLAEDRVDLAFLDIRMPGASGMEVAREVIRGGGAVVFTTAYEAHAVQAFEQGDVDSLLKPLKDEPLQRAIARWRERQRAGAVSAGIDLAALASLLESSAPARLRWISASLGDTVRLIDIDDVEAFHAEDKMTRVLAAGGDAVIRPTLKELLPQLDSSEFLQVHRSLIVRIGCIDRVRRDELGRYSLSLRGREERFPVSQGALPRLRAP